MFSVNRNPTTHDLQKFGQAMIIGFSLIGIILWIIPWWKNNQETIISWTGSGAQKTAVALWLLGIFLLLISYVSPRLTKPIYIVWMTVATFIGMIMTTIMLTVLFIVLLPIFSLIVRLGDPLRKKVNSSDSYWEDYKPHEPTLERMKRPF